MAFLSRSDASAVRLQPDRNSGLSQYLLAHLARRAIVTFCHTNASGVRRPSTLENKYSNIFYKTTGPTVLKFHMEHNLTPGSQKRKIESGRISKIASY